MDNIVKLCDEENRKFWFGISKVDRNQDEEDETWWNVRVVYENRWINYDENSESMTELELKAIAYEIEKRFIKKEKNNSERFSFIEPDYEIKFETSFKHAIFIINIGFADSINIWLNKDELIKIYNCICEALDIGKC